MKTNKEYNHFFFFPEAAANAKAWAAACSCMTMAMYAPVNKQLISDEKYYKQKKIEFRAQLFTSLKADLCQDTIEGFTFIMCLNGTFPSRNCSVMTLVY